MIRVCMRRSGNFTLSAAGLQHASRDMQVPERAATAAHAGSATGPGGGSDSTELAALRRLCRHHAAGRPFEGLWGPIEAAATVDPS